VCQGQSANKLLFPACASVATKYKPVRTQS